MTPEEHDLRIKELAVLGASSLHTWAGARKDGHTDPFRSCQHKDCACVREPKLVGLLKVTGDDSRS